MINNNETKYPTVREIEQISSRASELGYPMPVNANLYQLGQELYRSPSPRLNGENKLWKLLKESRRKQAQWRSVERNKYTGTVKNPDRLDKSTLRTAADIFVSLKERQASYGDAVFNFAFPLSNSESPPPICLPKNLPNVIWKMAEYMEKPFPQGLPMARIDAIRQSDNTIKIIEINPCWVDNLGALQAFYETYYSAGPQPVDMLCQQIVARQPRNRDIALLYTAQADGCKRDEIYALANYMRSGGYFSNILVSPMNSTLDIGNFGTVYINGSFQMSQQYSSEQRVVEQIKKLQVDKQLLLLPSQFTALDSKTSLIGMSQTRPDLFIPTTSDRREIEGPAIAKPLQSESLKGIVVLDASQGVDSPEEFVYQPIVTATTDMALATYNSKEKTLSSTSNLYEKINIWVVGNQVVGVMAAYDQEMMINDASYNLPLIWTTK
ncbi:MAG: hypothetical protein WC851_05540 [Candidatus Shapirobacteria bacterium]|jgi:hypothetical protein